MFNYGISQNIEPIKKNEKWQFLLSLLFLWKQIFNPKPQVFIQFVIFNRRKVPWNWIAFSQISLVVSPGLLNHLIRRDTGRLAKRPLRQILLFLLSSWTSSESLMYVQFTSCVYGVSGLKITNCIVSVS